MERFFYFCTRIKIFMGRAFEFRKARKMKRWSKMAIAFTRIGKDIVMAVKEGGPDPETNSRLRAVIQNAKSINMPKDNVDRAIKRASDKSLGDYKIILFEGGIVSAFGSFAGIALWQSNSNNNYALTGNYIAGTLTQAWALGKFLLGASTPPSSADVANQITDITGRTATTILDNFYITAVTQSTNSASLDAGIIRLDNNPDQGKSTETHYIYNLNENLIMYSSQSGVPDIIAPDSICYYSESTGLGFSNATDDLETYFDSKKNKSSGYAVSIIKIETASQLYETAGVIASFGGLLRNIGYAGALPYPDH